MNDYHFFFLSILIIVSWACKPNYANTEEPDTSSVSQTTQAVKIAPIQVDDTPIPLVASGTIGSSAESNLSFKVGGIIKDMLVKEGQRVKKGQLLAAIQTNEIDAQVLKAKQALAKANRDLDRIKNLYADSAATLEMVQDLTTVYEIANSDLEIATYNQQYAKIVAPASGRILKRFSEPGELVNPGTPVYQLASNQGRGFIMEIGIADKDIVKLRYNDRALVILDAYPNDTLKAYVTKIAEAADPRTGAFPIEITLPNGRLALRNGFIGQVILFPSQQAPYLKISLDALVEGDQQGVSIYVTDESKTTAKLQKVKPTYIGDDYFLVRANALDGVKWVITEGATFLKPDMPISIIE